MHYSLTKRSITQRLARLSAHRKESGRGDLFHRFRSQSASSGRNQIGRGRRPVAGQRSIRAAPRCARHRLRSSRRVPVAVSVDVPVTSPLGPGGVRVRASELRERANRGKVSERGGNGRLGRATERERSPPRGGGGGWGRWKGD